MSEWLQFWGSVAGILGLAVALLSLLRDTFNFQLKWSTSSNYVKRFIVSRRFQFGLIAILLGFSFWSLFSRIQNLG